MRACWHYQLETILRGRLKSPYKQDLILFFPKITETDSITDIQTNATENINFPNTDNLHINNRQVLKNQYIMAKAILNQNRLHFQLRITKNVWYLHEIIIFHVIIYRSFMKFTISTIHPVYQHCKVTTYLAVFCILMF